MESALSSLLSALENFVVGDSNDDSLNSTITIIDNSENNEVDLQQFTNQQSKLLALRSELRLIQGQGNVGYGAGHNLAIMKSTARFSLIMNSDIEVEERALNEGVNYLLGNPDVAAVSPQAQFKNGQKQYLCKHSPTVFDFFLRGFMPEGIRSLFNKRLALFEMRDLSEEHPTKDVPIISGCFMLCSTEALQKAAGFNEDYFLYFEDFDLSMRLSEINTLAYLPAMKIVHHGGNSARKGIKHIGLFIQSARRFFNTYGWRWF